LYSSKNPEIFLCRPQTFEWWCMFWTILFPQSKAMVWSVFECVIECVTCHLCTTCPIILLGFQQSLSSAPHCKSLRHTHAHVIIVWSQLVSTLPMPPVSLKKETSHQYTIYWRVGCMWCSLDVFHCFIIFVVVFCLQCICHLPV